MRFVLVALGCIVAASPSIVQAAGSCAPEHIGSPSCPYQWIGPTSVAFTGAGNALGFVGMSSQCRADFGPGARMCKSVEIMDSDTLNLSAIPSSGCWIRPSWRPTASGANGITLDESGTSATEYNMSCAGWSAANTTGLVLIAEGAFKLQPCAVARPVACCKPIAVGEPVSSIALPTGVGVLAMLSMLKGGA